MHDLEVSAAGHDGDTTGAVLAAGDGLDLKDAIVRCRRRLEECYGVCLQFLLVPVFTDASPPAASATDLRAFLTTRDYGGLEADEVIGRAERYVALAGSATTE